MCAIITVMINNNVLYYVLFLPMGAHSPLQERQTLYTVQAYKNDTTIALTTTTTHTQR